MLVVAALDSRVFGELDGRDLWKRRCIVCYGGLEGSGYWMAGFACR